MIRRTRVAVECDICHVRSVEATTVKEARVYASTGGFVRRNWRRGTRDLCAMCAGKTPVHDTTEENRP